MLPIYSKKTIFLLFSTLLFNKFAYNGFATRRMASQRYNTITTGSSFAVEGRDQSLIHYKQAEGAATIMQLHTAKADRPLNGEGTYASAGVTTLAEYRERARLPQYHGVAARVVEQLTKRIGHMSLAIDHVAKELNLSKRTLQRRLQQQELSYAQLRDQVRFHTAIHYLIELNLSVDTISSKLDFSDRTSFTNAFKRWTTLSPSLFRKLFRDYA